MKVRLETDKGMRFNPIPMMTKHGKYRRLAENIENLKYGKKQLHTSQFYTLDGPVDEVDGCFWPDYDRIVRTKSCMFAYPSIVEDEIVIERSVRRLDWSDDEV